MSTIRKRYLFVAACGGMAAFGFSLALLGTLFGFAAFRERLQVDVMRQGELTSVLMVGLWLTTVIVGPCIDRFGNKLVLSVSSFLLAAAFVGFLIADSFMLAVAAAVVLGFGGGGLNTSTNVVVSELYGEKRGAMLNILGIFFGLGAVMVPLIAARVSPQTAIMVAAGFGLICGLAYIGLPFPPAQEAQGFSLLQAAKVITYPGFLFFAFVLFFQSANEQVMNAFTSTWIGAAGATSRLATLIFAAYQLSMAIGRIIAAPMLSYVRKQTMVVASAIGSVLGTAIMFFSDSVTFMALGVVVTGLSFAAIYPTVLALAGDRYSRFAGSVFGTLFAIALLGGVVAPSAVGAIGGRFGVHHGTAVPLLGAVMVTLLVGVVLRREPRARQSEVKIAAAGE